MLAPYPSFLASGNGSDWFSQAIGPGTMPVGKRERELGFGDVAFNMAEFGGNLTKRVNIGGYTQPLASAMQSGRVMVNAVAVDVKNMHTDHLAEKLPIFQAKYPSGPTSGWLRQHVMISLPKLNYALRTVPLMRELFGRKKNASAFMSEYCFAGIQFSDDIFADLRRIKAKAVICQLAIDGRQSCHNLWHAARENVDSPQPMIGDVLWLVVRQREDDMSEYDEIHEAERRGQGDSNEMRERHRRDRCYLSIEPYFSKSNDFPDPIVYSNVDALTGRTTFIGGCWKVGTLVEISDRRSNPNGNIAKAKEVIKPLTDDDACNTAYFSLPMIKICLNVSS